MLGTQATRLQAFVKTLTVLAIVQVEIYLGTLRTLRVRASEPLAFQSRKLCHLKLNLKKIVVGIW
jgi:hypothetical protein